MERAKATSAPTTTSTMTYWRQAGLSYLRYSRIAAQQVRKSLKADSKVDPIKDTSTIKVSFKAKEAAAAKVRATSEPSS
ncbi:ATP synthase subunit epsilon, mitochondrial [Tyrophagus putrescentiae]|nr:ATP synthase subunit epsilon, mitochondrial [Tyrophagus putrescentiae]